MAALPFFKHKASTKRKEHLNTSPDCLKGFLVRQTTKQVCKFAQTAITSRMLGARKQAQNICYARCRFKRFRNVRADLELSKAV